jgi:hypothetical protein
MIRRFHPAVSKLGEQKIAAVKAYFDLRIRDLDSFHLVSEATASAPTIDRLVATNRSETLYAVWWHDLLELGQ